MQLIQELERTRDETLQYFSLGESDLARTYAPGKWSVRFLLHHLADSETVLFERREAVIYYAGQSYESKGHLEFVHSVTGLRTLKDEFDKVAAHNEHHLGQIRLALQNRS